MIDKIYCASSFLALRYIQKDEADFYEGVRHKISKQMQQEKKIKVFSSDDIQGQMQKSLEEIKQKGLKLGLLLSGGMDSAVCASFMRGCDAYTFRFLDGKFQKEELKRAQYYSKCYDLRLHFVDINYDKIADCIDLLIQEKGCPITSIEPQIYKAAMQAKEDDIDVMVVGGDSDTVFGGLSKLLSKDWTVEEFKKKYTFCPPELVLKNYYDMSYVFEKYRMQNNKIDFLKFIDEVYCTESLGSYDNPFLCAKMKYFDPYSSLVMGNPLDIKRIRAGESKYLIRELFAKRYPNIKVPEKIPMPRPVDFYFENWQGPKRKEFEENLDITKFTGNQKWQIWCLEKFFDMYENK